MNTTTDEGTFMNTMADWTDKELTDEIEALGPEPRNPIARAEWREDIDRVNAEITRRQNG